MWTLEAPNVSPFHSKIVGNADKVLPKQGHSEAKWGISECGLEYQSYKDTQQTLKGKKQANLKKGQWACFVGMKYCHLEKKPGEGKKWNGLSKKMMTS